MDEPYLLSCPVCHGRFEDTYQLTCPSGCNSLLRADYSAKQLTQRNLPGMFRFSDWLPVKNYLPTHASPICFQSSGLAGYLGLTDLWIGFSGYWPERSAFVTSGSFKEFEALPTYIRLRERASGVILVASAGNTGRAFAQVSTETGQPVIVVVPMKARERIWTSKPAEHLLLITVEGDYTDAITLGNTLCALPGIYPEGGARNIARRDGMGTVMLEGAVVMGRMPDWYIQAVGSGTGGIAAWEASLRLQNDGRFGAVLPRLLLLQNEPFIPMARAWEADRRNILPDIDMPDAQDSIAKVHADVLTNRAPPYGIVGGVYDALKATNGIMETVDSKESCEAGELFLELEGIDLDPAAAVCVAGLIKTVRSRTIRPDAKILLNITGGGYERIRKDGICITNKPAYMVDSSTSLEEITGFVSQWVKSHV